MSRQENRALKTTTRIRQIVERTICSGVSLQDCRVCTVPCNIGFTPHSSINCSDRDLGDAGRPVSTLGYSNVTNGRDLATYVCDIIVDLPPIHGDAVARAIARRSPRLSLFRSSHLRSPELVTSWEQGTPRFEIMRGRRWRTTISVGILRMVDVFLPSQSRRWVIQRFEIPYKT